MTIQVGLQWTRGSLSSRPTRAPHRLDCDKLCYMEELVSEVDMAVRSCIGARHWDHRETPASGQRVTTAGLPFP